MTAAAAALVRAAEFPPDIDVAKLLRPVRTKTWEVSSEYRRAVTRTSPLLFAVTYLGRYLRNSDTGVMSFSPWHMDSYARARLWLSREPQRDVVVAPREGGKSALYYKALPLWCLAHGHRRFFTAFSYTGSQALGHLGNLLDILHGRAGQTSQLLLQDFPELTPIRGAGGPRITVLRGGAEGRRAVAAYGMHESSLGLNVDELRPDLICHRAGTPMLVGDEWRPVEEHPSFRGYREAVGKTVRVWGLPFAETVTDEHRYWAKWVNGKRNTRRPAGWCEARDLDRYHYVGTPIDMTVETPPGWLENVQVDGANRDDLGRVYGAVWETQVVHPDRFDDASFWWLVGYWWGNGHLGSPRDRGSNYATVAVTVPNKRPDLANRVRSCVAATLTETPGVGACTVLSWSDAPLARWLRTWKQPGAGQAEKAPPVWVERLPLHLQQALVEGYSNADGDETSDVEVRVSSIWLPGLLMLRRIQARLGVAVTIRRGPGPRWETFPDGHRSWSKQKYDARWSLRNERYSITRTHIADGMLWSKVRSVEVSGVEKFAPIRTATSTYVTAFGLSHNCGDDIEPGGEKWSPKTRASTITALTENILPMGRRAVVQVVGTVVAPGSVIHDAVKAAQGSTRSSWVDQAGFRPHWYPAIVDEGGPNERSLWPQQWPLDELLKGRHDADGNLVLPGRYNADGTLNRAFALTKMNDPVRDTGGAYWSDTFRYLRPSVVRRWVCFVDPAKSTHETSDWTAYVVAGLLTTQKPAVVVAEAGQGHWSPREMRQRLDVLRGRFPGLQVFVESNALGSEENARDQYGLIRGDQGPWAHTSKELRIRAAADVYAEDLVRHAKPLPTLEDVLTDYGSGGRDDLPDALAGALGVLLPGKIPA